VRIAILAVHGVLPIVRHAFQDHVASALTDRLNRITAPGSWTMSAVFSRTARTAEPSAIEGPPIVRVHRADDDSSAPAHDFFDVQEVYWSPLVRGKTTAGAVLRWMLTTVVNPVNTTARCREKPSKALFDAAIVIAAVALGVAFLGGAVVAAAYAWRGIPPPGGSDEPAWRQPRLLAAFAVGLIAAYVFVLAVRSSFAIAKNSSELLKEPIQLWSRLAVVAALFLIAAAGWLWCSSLIAARTVGLLAGAVAAFQIGISLMGGFLVHFFGPVQVYMTRDQNASLFAAREQVMTLFIDALESTIRTPLDGPAYDRVYVLAHSLGSTIAMDGMLHLFNLSREGNILDHDFKRLRGFVSFGTSLEKTKYFFEAMHPTFSARYDEWRSDLYGALFTADRGSLQGSVASNGIYWLNCWYFSDIIADSIASYRSFVLPGEPPSAAQRHRMAIREEARRSGRRFIGRLVAENRQRFGRWFPWRPITHEDYLDDGWFWSRTRSGDIGALDVVTSGLAFTEPADVTPAHPQRRFEAAQREWWHPQGRDVIS